MYFLREGTTAPAVGGRPDETRRNENIEDMRVEPRGVEPLTF